MRASNEQWIWKFYSFIDSRDKSAVQNWYDTQNAKVQAEFDTIFKFLRVTPQSNWRVPYSKVLLGPCKGLIEVRFEANRNPYRAIGFYGPEQRVYTVVRVTDKHGFDGKCVREQKHKVLIGQSREYIHEPSCFSNIAKEAEE